MIGGLSGWYCCNRGLDKNPWRGSGKEEFRYEGFSLAFDVEDIHPVLVGNLGPRMVRSL